MSTLNIVSVYINVSILVTICLVLTHFSAMQNYLGNNPCSYMYMYVIYSAWKHPMYMTFYMYYLYMYTAGVVNSF